MKTYEAIFNQEVNKGVYGISLVYNPAMEGHFLTLSKQEEVQLKSIDEEKRILLGLVLEPNKLIYRNQGGEEFNVVFKEETIVQLAHNFIKEGYQHNSSIEHSGKVDGVTFVESWIVADSKKDKSVTFGLNYPKGSWLVMMKVDSDEVWNDYVKNGKVRGFSIDALVELKEVNNVQMSDNKKTLKEMFEEVLISFGMKKLKKDETVTEVKLGEVMSEDGAVKYMFDGDVLEVGKVLYAMDDEGNRVDLPAGEYKLQDGSVAVLEEGGVLKEMKAPNTQQEPAQMKDQTATDSGGLSQKDEEFMNAIKSILIKYSEQQDEVQKEKDLKLSESDTKLNDLTKEFEELKKELLELKQQPAAKAKKSAPVNFNEMTELEKRKWHRENTN